MNSVLVKDFNTSESILLDNGVEFVWAAWYDDGGLHISVVEGIEYFRLGVGIAVSTCSSYGRFTVSIDMYSDEHRELWRVALEFATKHFEGTVTK